MSQCLLRFPFLFTLSGISYHQKRSGISAERGRMIRRGEVLRAWAFGQEEKMGGVIVEKRGGCQGDMGWQHELSLLGSEVWWWIVMGDREGELLTAWETLRCHLAWGLVVGGKGQGLLTFDPDPLWANIPDPQIYGVLRNNNCQTPEAKANGFPPSSGV